jgi:hypothetical protein
MQYTCALGYASKCKWPKLQLTQACEPHSLHKVRLSTILKLPLAKAYEPLWFALRAYLANVLAKACEPHSKIELIPMALKFKYNTTAPSLGTFLLLILQIFKKCR